MKYINTEAITSLICLLEFDDDLQNEDVCRSYQEVIEQVLISAWLFWCLSTCWGDRWCISACELAQLSDHGLRYLFKHACTCVYVCMCVCVFVCVCVCVCV